MSQRCNCCHSVRTADEEALKALGPRVAVRVDDILALELVPNSAHSGIRGASVLVADLTAPSPLQLALCDAREHDINGYSLWCRARLVHVLDEAKALRVAPVDLGGTAPRVSVIAEQLEVYKGMLIRVD